MKNYLKEYELVSIGHLNIKVGDLNNRFIDFKDFGFDVDHGIDLVNFIEKEIPKYIERLEIDDKVEFNINYGVDEDGFENIGDGHYTYEDITKEAFEYIEEERYETIYIYNFTLTK